MKLGQRLAYLLSKQHAVFPKMFKVKKLETIFEKDLEEAKTELKKINSQQLEKNILLYY